MTEGVTKARKTVAASGIFLCVVPARSGRARRGWPMENAPVATEKACRLKVVRA